LLVSEVKHLQRSALLSLERDDELVPVQDGTLGLDGPSDHLIVVLEVDDDDIAGAFGRLLPDAEVVVGFKSLYVLAQRL
jgi:hypothetical protein